ncbi:dihydropteroate synthase [Saccharopolyspora sp. HNM0983]|uniref:Dihydropteroate synthase n=1 Tax=Saccharopolyspora montiporae TaxID=2781240 RepID=A0A929B9R0_9PSEU|nr:dihydropteroate synthase [Saccharopolyspora sp. HNM0983]MBE9374143.1 dihydropteroate synthase [Saccharopolyspora sp. HNM0983]
MGILNVTPNSFSDGGRYLDTDAAVVHGAEMFRAGADIIDVGGESTRPGSERVDAATEAERVLPVVRGLVAEGVPVSVDTTRAAVAEAVAEAGASIINDVSGGLADPDMARVAAETGLPWVLMHWRGHSKDMNSLASYDDVVAEVRSVLLRQVDAAVAAGVAEDAIVLDPGLGFAKTAAHDWQLLHRLDVLVDTGLPVLVGASRKRFLGGLLPGADGSPRPAGERDTATSVVSALSADRGAWGVRVHDVRGSLDAVAVTAEWNSGGASSG